MTTLALVELAARFGDPELGAREVEALLTDAAVPQDALVLLGECALTGYIDEAGGCDLRSFAESAVEPGEDLLRRSPSSLRSMAELAASTRCTFVAPCVERAGDDFFNGAVVIGTRGEVVTRYRKRHPWYPETWATPGGDPLATFEHAGLRFAIAICFDVHFLAAESVRELESADVLLFPSAWVDETRVDARTELLADLAMRFDVVVANANWGHGLPRVRGQGGSRVVRPDGTEQVLRASSSGVLVVEV